MPMVRPSQPGLTLPATWASHTPPLSALQLLLEAPNDEEVQWGLFDHRSLQMSPTGSKSC